MGLRQSKRNRAHDVYKFTLLALLLIGCESVDSSGGSSEERPDRGEPRADAGEGVRRDSGNTSVDSGDAPRADRALPVDGDRSPPQSLDMLPESDGTLTDRAVNERGMLVDLSEADQRALTGDTGLAPNDAAPGEDLRIEEDQGRVDTDLDGVIDRLDNCPEVANEAQRDDDRDGLGDLCDPEPGRFNYQLLSSSVGLAGGSGFSPRFRLRGRVLLGAGEGVTATRRLVSKISQ